MKFLAILQSDNSVRYINFAHITSIEDKGGAGKQVMHIRIAGSSDPYYISTQSYDIVRKQLEQHGLVGSLPKE